MLFGGIAALLLHIVFLLVFWALGVVPLAVFNILSVLLFVANITYLYRTGSTVVAVVLSAVEVIVHQSLAVTILGWDFGFQYYLLCVPAFVFLGRFPNALIPAGLSGINFSVLVWLYISGQTVIPHWSVPKSAQEGFYTLNLFSAATLLALFSFIYNRMASLQEQALLEANERTRQASEAKSDFLATMSHEFRTPMNAVVGFTDLALRRESQDSQTRRDLLRIRGASRSLLNLINDVLDFSKIEAGKLEIVSEEFDLHELIRKLGELFGPATSQKGLEFLLDLDPYLPRMVRGDSLRLHQVLTNLTSNAVKFTSSGEIKIRAKTVDSSKDVVRFSVSDTGRGIPQDQLHRLFDPFTQADKLVQKDFGGTGLGLSICRRLVNLMGGELRAESLVGKGSEFSFELPMAGLDEDRAEAPSRRGSYADTKVLVVESNFSSRNFLVDSLSSFGFEVHSAARDDHALEMLAHSLEQPFDLVLFDADVPSSSCFEFLRLVRQAVPESQWPHFVFLVAHGWENSVDAAHSGISCVLCKPVTPSSLLDSLVAVIHEAGLAGEPIEVDQLESLENVHLLVVDDVELNRDLAKEMLESAGAKVTLAASGTECLELLSTNSFDAVLMDINMPELDGYQTTRALRETGHESLPIIAMTAHALAGDRQKSLEAGLNDHITKPISLEAITASLKLWLAPEKFAPGPSVTGGEQTNYFPALATHLDEKGAMKRLKGNRNLLHRLLIKFAERYRAVEEKWWEVARTGDVPVLKDLAHQLKGAAANLSLTEVEARAGELEMYLSAGEPEQPRIESLVGACLNLLRTVVADIEVLGGLEESGPSQAVEPLSREDILELAERLRQNRLDTQAWLEQRSDALRRTLGSDFATFWRAVENLEFEEACKHLEPHLPA